MRGGALLVVALLSATIVALELVWTRIFSAEFFYTYAFLTLSMAIAGLGLGGLALRLFPFLHRPGGLFLALCGVTALVGSPLVFHLGLDFSLLYGSWGMIARFVLTLIILGAPFFFGGIALASYFRRYHPEMPRLYMADLLGAGAGVVLAMWMMNRVGTPMATVWVALPVFLAALLASRRWFRLLPLVLIAAMVVFGNRIDTLLEAERKEPAPVVYKHWDAMAKIKVYAFAPEYRGINIDNVANTPVIQFDGNWEETEEDTTSEEGWDIDVGYLINRFDSCTFLSLGAGGGADVLQALGHGAAEVHAVEVNPHINRMMLEGDPSGYGTPDSAVVDSTGRLITMPEFSGNLYRDPRVKVVSEDARTYVRRHKNTFDVIFSLSSNTWAALGSGSFALAENYLFTTEAFGDYWDALTENGFLSMEHQVYVPRLVSEVIDALQKRGIKHPRSHFAVYNLPKLRRKLILLSKRPLTDEIRALAYGELTPEVFDTRHLLFPAADSLKDNLVNRIIVNGWRAEADSAATDISPCTDDRPFVAQMGLWRNLDRSKLEKLSKYAEFRGFPVSKISIAIILAVVVVLLIPLNLLPYLTRGAKLRFVPWLYFFLIGVAFISVEVVLIQKYALFIGASVYSIATVLLALLVASGIGSRFAAKLSHRTAFTGILVWLVLEIFLFRHITNGLAGLTLVPRVLVSGLLVCPLGFFMGMPFPKGGLRVGELVDWGFAVNGAASVLGATLIVLVAFTYGFAVALLGAAVLYLAAYMLMSAKRLW
jgi:hypothetical protein